LSGENDGGVEDQACTGHARGGHEKNERRSNTAEHARVESWHQVSLFFLGSGKQLDGPSCSFKFDADLSCNRCFSIQVRQVLISAKKAPEEITTAD
jgi:hypothetical protein